MNLIRFVTTAAAAAMLAAPAAAFAAGDAPAAASAPAAPAPAAPALPSIPKVVGGSDIYATLKSSGQFTLLLKAVDQTGLAPILQRYPITMFAPTDAAINALPADVLTKLMAANDTAANQLQQILKYHLINAQVDSSKIKGAKGPVATVENQTVLLDGSNPEDMLVNNADIIQADVKASNGGVIHVIDKVLIPSDSPYAAQVAPPPAAPTAPAAPAGTQ
ncbi:MAG TPA: fasciclin domain-containing protein [Caulobacteraceae bacterium]|nr:fasciclin domain-containing protein [Caulobacteraceae bacterium]